MNVACLQFDPAWEDRENNFAAVRRWLEVGQFEPGGLIVLPEMFATGFSMNVDGVAESPPFQSETFQAEIAERSGCAVMAGVVIRADDGGAFNVSLTVAPDGRRLAEYRKIRTFSYTGEGAHYQRGDRVVLFEWQGWRVCPLICYDLRFPELFRAAVGAGAELFVVIANWPAVRSDHWTTLLRSRAIENQACVVGVNRTGSDPALEYSGQSLVVDARGEIIADAGESEGWMTARLDRDDLLEWRREFPALADRLDDTSGLV